MPAELPEERRQVVFAALVAAQDDGQSVAASRAAVAEQHGLSPDQVLAIEREGLEQQWPPL